MANWRATGQSSATHTGQALPGRARGTGFSLLELMLATGLGLMLMASIALVYLGSKQTYTVRDELSVMQENARTALLALQRNLEHTGYRTPAHLPLANAFYTLVDPQPIARVCEGGVSNLADPSVLRQTQDDDTNTGTGDSIGMLFIADQALFTDCSQAVLPASCRIGTAASTTHAHLYNSFYVATPAGEDVPNLYCASSNGVQPLVQGVENAQFAYGVDSDGNQMVDTYLDATEVGAANAWQRVVSIKVALLMRSRVPIFPNAEERTYSLLGKDFTRNDRFQRTVHSSVIYLRNLATGGG